MSNLHIDHLNYTLTEWSKNPYFCEITDYLKNNQIKNYIDIGANVGGVCQHLLNNIKDLQKVYLFEPQKDNYNFIVNNFKENKNIECINKGIYYGLEYCNMHMINGNVGGYSVHKYYKFTTENSLSYFTTLEDFNLNNIDFIKIDTEGSEFNIIENSLNLKAAKFLDIEFHMSPNATFGDVSDTESIKNYIKHHLPNFKLILNNFTNFFLKNLN